MTLNHWKRADNGRSWDSIDGKWRVYDTWSLGRLTQIRKAYGISDHDIGWNEIYSFTRSRPAGRVDDGIDADN